MLVNNWAVKRGVWRSRVDGSREILVMLGATSIYKRSETKDGFPKFLGDLLVTGISWAHLLSSHSSRLICNADNSCWHILTAQNHQDKSLHWKNVVRLVCTRYELSRKKQCGNGRKRRCTSGLRCAAPAQLLHPITLSGQPNPHKIPPSYIPRWPTNSKVSQNWEYFEAKLFLIFNLIFKFSLNDQNGNV